MSRSNDECQLERALASVTTASEILAAGPRTDPSTRSERFVEQMLHRDLPDEGDIFQPFIESPVSGSYNPLSPLHVSIRRDGESVRAEVLIGVAMEGAPGRAHGGITAALFDDIMGAVQVLIDKSGYTRKLTIEYLAPFPVGETVEIIAREVAADPGLFAVDAEARVGEQMIASAHGTFTTVETRRFAKL